MDVYSILFPQSYDNFIGFWPIPIVNTIVYWLRLTGMIRQVLLFYVDQTGHLRSSLPLRFLANSERHRLRGEWILTQIVASHIVAIGSVFKPGTSRMLLKIGVQQMLGLCMFCYACIYYIYISYYMRYIYNMHIHIFIANLTRTYHIQYRNTII